MKIQYFSADSDRNGKKASCLQFTQKKTRGSLTVEAAVALPVTLLTLAGFLLFFSFLVTELKIQAAIDRVAENLAGYYYGIEKLGDTEIGQEIAELADVPLVSDAVSALAVKALVTDELEGAAGDGLIAGGTAGIVFLGSGYEEETKNVTIRASYALKIPFLPFSGLFLPVTQQAVRRAFVGQPLGGEEEEPEAYVTENGKVFHTSLACTYLKLSIREVLLSQVPGLRNSSGGKYYACELCGDGHGEKVFITDYGDRYHYQKNCAGLKRGIRSMPREQAESQFPMCSRCKAREGTSP